MERTSWMKSVVWPRTRIFSPRAMGPLSLRAITLMRAKKSSTSPRTFSLLEAVGAGRTSFAGAFLRAGAFFAARTFFFAGLRFFDAGFAFFFLAMTSPFRSGRAGPGRLPGVGLDLDGGVADVESLAQVGVQLFDQVLLAGHALPGQGQVHGEGVDVRAQAPDVKVPDGARSRDLLDGQDDPVPLHALGGAFEE